MNVGYFINRAETPLEKIDWTALKSGGISEVYIRCAESNLEAISLYLPKIKAAGLKPYAWTMEGYTRYTETTAKGWNIVADIEGYDMPSHVPEIKNIQSICKSYQKTFILCTKAQDWDGDQIYSTLIPLVDYLMPMLYIGDYNKTVLQLGNWMLKYNHLYPGKIYPALETYISDENPVAKTNAAITAELNMIEPYCKAAALFRYGISNYKPIVVTPVVSYTISQWKVIQTRLKALGYYSGLVDGIAGPVTIAAVKAFQQAKGLLVDGVVGPVTLKALGIDFSTPAVVGPLQKQIQTGTGRTFTNFTGFYNLIKVYCDYAYYFNGQNSVSNEAQMIINDINGAAKGLNCVDYTQFGVKLAKEMGYTAVPYGIYCPVDKINHAIFLIKGKEFAASTWIDLAAAASSSYDIGRHWCSGVLTKEPNWIPYE